MPRVNKNEIWDLVEEQLFAISETRTGKHVGEIKLIIALLVSAGRDNDIEFINSDFFKELASTAYLDPHDTQLIILSLISKLQQKKHGINKSKLGGNNGHRK